jgi:cyclic pyranopterin monophosphate synthase
MNKFSHIDDLGKAKMVDISNKISQIRVAKAEGRIMLLKSTLKLIKENQIKKGDVLTVAQIAGIQAVKRTSELIPLCHPLQISDIDIKALVEKDCVKIISEVKSTGQTGVEMEALTAVSIALLTIYDMCKAVDKNMVITDIKLIEKTKMDLSD